MVSGKGNEFSVGDWLVEPDLNCISLGPQRTTLRPQVMELLVYLARQDGRVVSADELLENLWTGKVVTGNTVYNCIAELRHALADGKDATPYVETVPKRGYRLLAPVASLSDSPDSDRQWPLSSGKRVAIIVAACIGLAVTAWLTISHERTAEKQTTSSMSISVASGTDESRRMPESQNSNLQLALSLPDYADQSTNYAWPSVALSPDGRKIAYIGFDEHDVHLYLKPADAAEARRQLGIG